MENKHLTIYDLALAMQEGFEKIDKRLERIEAVIEATDSQKEVLDARLTRLEQQIHNTR